MLNVLKGMTKVWLRYIKGMIIVCQKYHDTFRCERYVKRFAICYHLKRIFIPFKGISIPSKGMVIRLKGIKIPFHFGDAP